jgi:hypothetical protein
MSTPTALRARLVALTVDLRAVGVTGFAYPTEAIARMSRGQLVSCIAWAEGLLAHIAAA